MAKKDFSGDSASSRRLSGASAILSAGRLSLYTENAFRILGMPVDATDIELQERHDTLKAYATLKRVKEVYTVAFGCTPPPSAHQLDAALERVNDGEERASDEFFWFWPRSLGEENDAGLEAIADGNSTEALRIWREWEQEDGLACAVARHNLAVNFLMLALEETAKHLAGTLAKTQETRLENTWKNADKRWGAIADDRHIWDETKKRIRSKGDPALTAALADQMKSDLRKTLAAIHGDIARHYAEKGMLEQAKFHVDAMLDDDGVDDEYRATIREVTKPVRDRLEAARTQAQSLANSPDRAKKKQAFSRANDFFENDFEQKAKPMLELFYTGGKIDSVLKKEKEGIYDKVAETICNCCVATANARKEAREKIDATTLIKLLKAAQDIATDRNILDRIKKNAEALDGEGRNPFGDAPEEVIQAIASVKQDEDTVKASERFRRLQRARPKLKAWAAKNAGKMECRALLKIFAMMERSLSVEIFNKEDNRTLAITVIKCAIEDTPDAADRKKFEKDLEQLEDGGELGELTQIFKRIAESNDGATARFGELVQVRERFQKWADTHPGHDMCNPLMKAFAGLERGLSVGMFNEAAELMKNSWQRDEGLELVPMAIFAACCAIEDTPDDDDRRKFWGDYNQLVAVAKKLGISSSKIHKPNLSRRKAKPVSKPERKPTGFRPDPPTDSRRMKILPNAVAKTFTEFTTPVHLWQKLSWTFLFTALMLIPALVFYRHYPDGTPFGKGHLLWWHFLLVGGASIGLPVSLFSAPPTHLFKLQIVWMTWFAISLFALSFSFRHYYPDGMPVATFVVQGWHLPVLGAVTGLLFPFYKLPRPLLVFFVALHRWGLCFTVLAGIVVLVRNAIISESLTSGLWRVPLIGFVISVLISAITALKGFKG